MKKITFNRAVVLKIIIYGLSACFLLGILIYGINTGFGFSDMKKTDGKLTNSYDYTATAADISNIDVDWMSGDIELKIGSGKEITVTESASGKLAGKEKLIMESQRDTLKISWNDKPWYERLGFFKNSKKLVITIPKTMKLGVVKINGANSKITMGAFNAAEVSARNAAGDINVKSVKAGNIEIKSASGKIITEKLVATTLTIDSATGGVTLKGSVIDECKINTVSGNIKATGGLFGIDVQSVSGNVAVETGVMPLSTKVGTVSGMLSLKVPENKGFLFKEETIVGKLTTSMAIQKVNDDSYYKSPVANNKVEMKTTSGDMSIEKGKSLKKVTTYLKWKEAQTAKEKKKTETSSASASE